MPLLEPVDRPQQAFDALHRIRATRQAAPATLRY